MLTHSVIGPSEDGSFVVAHSIPGCNVMSATLVCRTQAQAQREVDRLHQEQAEQEEAARLEREMRALRRFQMLALGGRGI